MMKKCTLCWAVSGLLALALAFGVYTFLIKGSTMQADDGRTAILLAPGERDHVLGEMRGLLEAVQSITEGLANDDMEQVAASATSVGMALAGDENPTLIAKLPLQFKKNGFAAHTAFDNLAANARDFGDKDMLLQELSVILGACTACHAGYRIALEDN
ncbi:MAG: hypothetical protein V3U96_11550 [Paracoccaceae bacterium]